MPGLLLPRAPYDIFFSYDFSGIVGGYGLLRMFLHYIRLSCDFFMNYSEQIRTEVARGLQCYRRTVSVRFSFGKRLTEHRAISARSSRGLRVRIVHFQYDMSTNFLIHNRRGCGTGEFVR